MAFQFNTGPYYADYEASTNYYDFLFRPGYAVQVRELTGLQQILEEQVRRFGKHIFQDGSMVIPGQISLDQNVSYVKINPTFSSSAISWELIDPLQTGTNVTIIGATTGVQAIVTAVDQVNFAIFVKYSSAGTDNVTSIFADNEILKVLPANLGIATSISSGSTGITSAASIGDGIYFIFGRFLAVNSQYIIVSPFDPNPSARIGLKIVENIVTPEDVPALTDNATGTPNYAAPGAHRYQINLVLISKPLTDTDDSAFIELIRVNVGTIEKLVDTTEYAEIEKMIARRTKDSDGDFCVRPYTFSIREHLNDGAGNGGVYLSGQGGDESKISIEVSPGKSYVDGYEIKNLVTQHVPMDKGRDTANFTNSRTRAYLGNYVYINRLFGLPNYDTLPQVNLYNVHITTDGVAPVVGPIGTATIRGMEFFEGTFGSIGAAGPIFKTYLTDINLTTGTLADLRSFAVSDGTLTTTGNVLNEVDLVNVVGDFSPGTTITAGSVTETVYAWNTDTNFIITLPQNGSNIPLNVPLTSSSSGTASAAGRVVLFDVADNLLIYPLPQTGVASVRDKTDAVTTTYSYRKVFAPQAESGGGVTFVTSTNESFGSLNVTDYFAVIETGSNAGKLIDITGASPVFTSALTQLTFSVPSGTTVKLSATVVKQLAQEKSKTLVNATLSVAATVPNVISLGKCDCFSYNIFNGTDDTAPIINTSYKFDTGQRPNLYDFGTLTYIPGMPPPTGPVFIKFQYFAHGSGDYFSVDSYRNFGDFDNWFALIPSFVNVDGSLFIMSDYLDFRSKRDETVPSEIVYPSGVGKLVKPNDDVITDFSYYLSRTDKLYITGGGGGQFVILRGSPAINPVPPKDPSDGMVLGSFTVNPYTYNIKDVIQQIVDNRNYTKRDIGKLDGRISNLEYEVSLNLLEQSAQNFAIPDAVTGLNRFKNGFVVDPFTDSSIEDVLNPDVKCSIDAVGQIMRPMFNSDSIAMDYTPSQSSSLAYQELLSENSLVTLPYVEIPLVTQPLASRIENVNPYNIFNYIGVVFLDPSTDTWKDTTNAPAVLVQNDSVYDAVVAATGGQNGNGIVWNDWQTEWTGVDKRTYVQESITGAPHTVPQPPSTSNIAGYMQAPAGVTYYRQLDSFSNVTVATTTTDQARNGVQTSVTPGATETTIDNKVLSVALQPYCRSIPVNWKAERLKPNTKHYLFFDDISIDAFSTGEPIVSDATGNASGVFTIPAQTFRVGARVFKICDDSQNRDLFITSMGMVTYNASGLLETDQSTITSTIEPVVQVQDVTQTQVLTSVATSQQLISTKWVDPLAQSFLVSNLTTGYFVTSIDLYLQTADASVPLVVQIRTMQNGIPTQTIVPFSDVTVPAANCHTSSDATVRTHVNFQCPVYLQSNEEYAIVLMSNSNNYSVWCAAIGDNQVNTNNLISTPPYTGSLFKSKNSSTWTPEQTEVFKFTLYRAKFDTSATGMAYFANENLPSHTTGPLPIITCNGFNTVRILDTNHGMPPGSKVTITIPPGAVSGGSFVNWLEDYNGIPVTDIVPTISGDLRNSSQPSGVADVVLGSRTYTVSNSELDSYTIQITDGSNAAVNATNSGYTGIAMNVTYNRLIDVIHPFSQQIQLAGTSLNWFMRNITGQSTHGTQVPYERDVTGGFPFTAIVPNQNINLNYPLIVASLVNETNVINLGSSFNNKSLVFLAELTTTLDNLSPVIDTDRVSAIVIANRIDNRTTVSVPSTSPTAAQPTYVGEIVNTGNTAPFRYAHKAAVLQNVSDAIHLLVSVMRPPEAIVECWYRIVPSETNDTLISQGWTQMQIATQGNIPGDTSPAQNSTDFKDYYFAADNIGNFTSFQTKIVARSTNSSRVPLFQALRVFGLDE